MDQLKALLGNSLLTVLGKGWDMEWPDARPCAGLLAANSNPDLLWVTTSAMTLLQPVRKGESWSFVIY